jgi:hypothetical protein
LPELFTNHANFYIYIYLNNTGTVPVLYFNTSDFLYMTHLFVFRLTLHNLRVEENSVARAAAFLLESNDNNNQLFDLVVSNPPYVLRKDLAAVAPEISLYEDLRALDGGADGLEVILPILQLADKVMLGIGVH